MSDQSSKFKLISRSLLEIQSNDELPMKKSVTFPFDEAQKFIPRAKPRQFNNIQAMRGVAALIVVFFHFMGFEKLYGHGLALLPSFFDFGACGVDIFFVISGFVMATIIYGKFQQPNAIIHFLVNRITRIYPLYWMCSLLTLLALWICGFLFHMNFVNHSSLIKSFLLLPQSGFPLLAVGWTLVYEMYFYFVIAFLLFFPEKRFLTMLGVWTIFIIVGSFFTFESANMQLITSPLACEFIAGCLIARLLHRNNKVFGISVFVLGILLLFIGFGIYHFIWPQAMPMGWKRVDLFGIPSIMLIYGAINVELNATIFPKLLCRLGDISYSIYLLHYPILWVFGKLLEKIHSDKLLYHLIYFVVALSIILFSALVSYYYLEKPLMLYFRRAFTFNKVVNVS